MQHVLTTHTAWFVCTSQIPRTSGFALNSVGKLYFQNSSDFYLCPINSQPALAARQVLSTVTSEKGAVTMMDGTGIQTTTAASGSITTYIGSVPTGLGFTESVSTVVISTVVAGSDLQGEWRFFPASYGSRPDCYSVGLQGSRCFQSDSPTSVMSASNVPFPTGAGYGSNSTQPFIGAAVAGKNANIVAAGIVGVAAGVFGLLMM